MDTAIIVGAVALWVAGMTSKDGFLATVCFLVMILAVFAVFAEP